MARASASIAESARWRCDRSPRISLANSRNSYNVLKSDHANIPETTAGSNKGGLKSLSVFMRTLGSQVDKPQVDERPQLLRAANGPKTGRKQRVFGPACPTAGAAAGA